MVEVFPFFEFIGSIKIDGEIDARMDQHTLYGFNNFWYFFVWEPLFLSDHLLADISLFDVRVPDRCFKFDAWKFEWELLREIKVKD